jgi:hypothetical protein
MLFSTEIKLQLHFGRTMIFVCFMGKNVQIAFWQPRGPAHTEPRQQEIAVL